MVDLRSDTVTKPTIEMREAIKNAEVGDDVLGDDPTIIQLQDMIAELLGKEAALFVPSGTMSNAVAIRTHTQPGDEIITERFSHIYMYEGGGYAALSGCSIALVDGKLGIMEPEDVEKAIRKEDGSLGHFPNGSLVCVENTSNRGGGTFYDLESLDKICEIAHVNDCKIHMDGARLFNAVIESGIDAKRMVKNFDTISICLSKGLGAPVGSLLVGSKEDISKAHRWRKLFGGGMRQAGVIAAAGIYALENNIERLQDDHQRAKELGNTLNGLSYVKEVLPVYTNIVVFEIVDGIDFNKIILKLEEKGLRSVAFGPQQIRFVTHLNFTDTMLTKAINILKSISE